MFETQTTTFETDYDPLETHDAESTDLNNNTASPTDEPNPTAESPTETPAGNSTAKPSDPVETPESLQTSTPDTQETNVPNAVETSSPSESLIPANTVAANTSVTTASATTTSAATASATTTSAAKVGDTFTFKKGLYKITSISEGNQTATYLKYKSDSTLYEILEKIINHYKTNSKIRIDVDFNPSQMM
jgi:outer membrane biosynthesis protein TonB